MEMTKFMSLLWLYIEYTSSFELGWFRAVVLNFHAWSWGFREIPTQHSRALNYCTHSTQF